MWVSDDKVNERPFVKRSEELVELSSVDSNKLQDNFTLTSDFSDIAMLLNCSVIAFGPIILKTSKLLFGLLSYS